jgi:hypothetical protein
VTMPPGKIAVADGTLTVDGVRLALLRPNRTATGSITIAPQRMLDPAADPDVYILATSEPRLPQVQELPLTPDELRASVHRVLDTNLPITAVRWARSTVANSRQAEAYRSGRAFIAGDAAHVFSAGGEAPSTSGCWTRSTLAGNWPSPRAAPPRRVCSTPTSLNATPPGAGPSCTRVRRRLCRPLVRTPRPCARSSVNYCSTRARWRSWPRSWRALT